MALWLVRAGKHGEQEDYALGNNVAVVGWHELPDLSGIESRDELLSLLLKTYPDDKDKTLKSWENQIWTFIKRI